MQVDDSSRINWLMRKNGADDAKVAADLGSDADARRASIIKKAKAAKRTDYAAFAPQRDSLSAQIAAGDAAEQAAAKDADDKLRAVNKLRERFSQIHDTITAANAVQDAILRANAPPSIADFIAEMEGLKAEAAGWAVNSMSIIEKRIRQLNEAIESAQRLVFDMNVDDIDAGIAQLRASVQGSAK